MVTNPKNKNPARKTTRPNLQPISQPPPETLDLKSIRQNVLGQLPMMFQNALDAYHDILHITDAEDHKLIQARHSAAKTALTHIQQLVRLGDWAMIEQSNLGDTAQSLADIIETARAQMNAQDQIRQSPIEDDGHEFTFNEDDDEEDYIPIATHKDEKNV